MLAWPGLVLDRISNDKVVGRNDGAQGEIDLLLSAINHHPIIVTPPRPG